ncbi:type IV pilus assembly protein PilY1 [Ralstonia sp. 25mfcol4.1]|uniref:pilus assembly protein n=1 Tax=Ralstonia sp. 25mfcol4.1 TaxID=1761899 RepID=UPI0003FFEBBA|nr:PilC/PilY family type IV pilus protein [Ralstonia sp. 25mfcol4.1]SDO69966.1 type IV pilus assembly protein PilY1 [Ralstonia sp. 25mfcol4.1]
MTYPTSSRRFVSRVQAALLAASSMLAIASASAAGPQLTLAQRPLFAGGNVPPMVMIDLTKDHTLHQRAYNDYTDLDGDGKLDTTYTNSIEYAGYFDSAKCYTYDKTTIKGFVPKALVDKDTKYCDGSTWSGNFLNWATMSRIDEVRKILYGGMRSTDTTTTTVLERAFLPMDAHAWAKFYNGADVAKLVPVPVEVASAIGTLTSNTRMSLAAAAASNIALSDVSKVQIGDQLRFEPTSGATAGSSMTGWVMKVNSGSVNMAFYADGVSNPGGTSTQFSSWKVTNLTRGGLTLCNVTPKDANNLNSQTNQQAPQIRVVAGNYATWGASEKWQCNWYAEANNTQGSFLPKINGTTVSGSSNGNRAALSGINSSAENPQQSVRGLGTGQDVGVYNARVQVCVNGLIGSEKCDPNNNKPIGLLQKYGGPGQMLFGLMTGSYDKNISGGVLRRNVTNFASEFNPDTGVFTYSAATNPVKGIVWNIDKLRPYGYSYSDGTYLSADQCNYQQTGIQPSGGTNAQNKPASEGNCSTWGNPISEIFVETLRYFGGKTATSAFQPVSNGKDATLGLTQPAWANPMDLPKTNASRAPYCTPLNALVFNSSVSSYDDDQLSGMSALNGAPDISTYTNKVGVGENIAGGSWFAGGISGKTIDNLCSAKSVGNLSDVLGICPEGPSQKGTFQIAGAALFAKQNRLRSDADAATLGVPVQDTTSLKMNTYAVQLATNTPKISVNVNGKTVTIMPSYQLHPQSPNGVTAAASTGTLVDFKVISQTATSGKFYVNWEDSIAGGDYDQDVWGILSYNVSGDTITVSTRVVSGSSANGQGFGYSISGTSQDGPHFHSGIYDFQYSDPTNIKVTPSSAPINTTGGCNKCNFGDPETSVVYTANGKAGSQFQDPLLYAAKWGGFNDQNGSGTPDQTSEWDVTLSNGSKGSDGVPDNYFYATNPVALAAALENAFLSILKTSSAAAVAASTTSLKTDSSIFQARFNGSDWSGQVLAYRLDKNGNIASQEKWDAGAKLKGVNQDSRAILTYNTADTNSAGIPFRWDSLPTAYQTALNGTDKLGTKRLLWLRGDQSNEQTMFRARSTALGDIVNSSPQYVGTPAAGYGDATYVAFVAAQSKRKPMIYVGANDGMLHAFSADMSDDPASDGGKELFAYVPSALYGKLADLTAPKYAHSYYVDSTPTITDAYVNSAWKTVLVGGLGGGGKGIYALDVTNPMAINESTAASTALWEFTSADDADLGYTYGRPKIVRLGNGKWAAVFGNGLNSTAARGSIFVIFLDRPAGSKTWRLGTDYLKLTVNDATDAQKKSNGIMQVYVTDTDGDYVADAIYAGDLLGNVWKFDVSGKTAAAYQDTRQLLFKATDAGGNAQPITTSFGGVRNRWGGYIMMFGTGRYVDVGDPANMGTQSVYGIWDKNSSGQLTITRSQLVQQSITMEAQYKGGDWYRVLSKNPVNYSGGAMGWYLNLVSPGADPQGERVVYDPQITGTRLLFSTLVPSSDLCEYGGTGWEMLIDGLTGGQTVAMFDANGDGKFDGSDAVGGSGNTAGQVVNGKKSNNGILTNSTVIGNNSYTSGSGSNGSTGGGISRNTINTGYPTGRVSWRQIQR